MHVVRGSRSNFVIGSSKRWSGGAQICILLHWIQFPATADINNGSCPLPITTHIDQRGEVSRVKQPSWLAWQWIKQELCIISLLTSTFGRGILLLGLGCLCDVSLTLTSYRCPTFPYCTLVFFLFCKAHLQHINKLLHIFLHIAGQIIKVVFLSVTVT